MSKVNDVLAGRYVLKDLIGQGGMADVYLAEDTILHRDVAIKILRSSLTGDPVYVTRFHREAKAAATLTHTNIVSIYDVGDEDDNYYIVMEYVPGQTLKELIHKRGALHYKEAVTIMRQILSATEKAHSMGIIHRDLKPQNVLITDSNVAKITDFGIASIQSLSQVTQSDTIMGSLHYLAPEIARGEKATVQSDIYALGIVFYELLRGEVPFDGESPVNIALKHMRDDIPSIREFNPTIPQSIENIIIKATAKNTDNRYSSVKEMLDDLNTYEERLDEEKLVFEYEENEETLIADEGKFFTTSEDDQKSKNKKNKKKLYITIGLIALAILLIGGLLYFLFAGQDNFSMPDLVGLTEEEALVILDDKGLEYDEDEFIEELSSEYEEGYVIASDPEASSSVHSGDSVVLTISSGKYIVVENYTGWTYEDAKEDLEEKGFTVYKETASSDETIGNVIGQSVDATEEYNPNTKLKEITLTVSKGIEITVPNVYGQTIENAKSLLESSDYGFTVKLETLEAPTTASELAGLKTNVVYDQSISAYTKLTKTDDLSITLYYYDELPDLTEEEESTESDDSEETTEENEESE